MLKSVEKHFDNSLKSVDDLIEAVGGTNTAARLIREVTGKGCGPSAVSNWRTFRKIPSDLYPAFGKILGFEPPRRLFTFRELVP